MVKPGTTCLGYVGLFRRVEERVVGWIELFLPCLFQKVNTGTVIAKSAGSHKC